MAKPNPSEPDPSGALAPPSPDAQRQRTTVVHPRPIQVAMAVTGAHVLITAFAVVAGNWAQTVLVVFSLGAFLLGAVVYAVAFVIAASRSRDEELWFGGAFFLTESVAAQPARRALYSCLALQCVTGIAGAVIAPFTAMAFGILVPLFGLGSLAWYGARWGEFSPKAPTKPKTKPVRVDPATTTASAPATPGQTAEPNRKATPSRRAEPSRTADKASRSVKASTNKPATSRRAKKKSGSLSAKPLQRRGTDDGETTQKGSKE